MENTENSQRALGPFYQCNLCFKDLYLCSNVKTMRTHYRDRHNSKLSGDEFKRLITEKKDEEICKFIQLI